MTTPEPLPMPMLARGQHQSPRHGACFMELASYLAGEPWSDAPNCTHWALAQLARIVNDLTTDEKRPLLAPLVPLVIGQTDFDDGFAEDLALIAATAALPVAAPDLERSIALGMLRIGAGAGDYAHSASAPWPQRAQDALTHEADAEALAWAHRSAARMGRIETGASAATSLTLVSARAIAESSAPDAQDRLRELLRSAIAWAHERSGTDPATIAALRPDQWQDVVAAA
ncbi:hypothetical protein GCG21_09775 [Pseudactinotalea sp. HY160]|uniref:hypothetical protein n=1 Tax=Pseudactinotalea sp. HY160 TaxID=2654490 RepID=UPI00128CC8EA|nr:hypothetical protein [Pseudactinotalea sp. HY160]MPV50285.1 hypothetical protein [Pseudactinotalea sp. HY160]